MTELQKAKYKLELAKTRLENLKAFKPRTIRGALEKIELMTVALRRVQEAEEACIQALWLDDNTANQEIFEMHRILGWLSPPKNEEIINLFSFKSSPRNNFLNYYKG